jgi:hypothetical protein
MYGILSAAYGIADRGYSARAHMPRASDSKSAVRGQRTYNSSSSTTMCQSQELCQDDICQVKLFVCGVQVSQRVWRTDMIQLHGLRSSSPFCTCGVGI